MSFERLIVCVDTSGSMYSSNKLINAKKLLLEVVNAFGCETKYFKFTSAPSELSSYQFSNLSAGGGTRIEYTLKQLFGNHFRKWAHYGKNTKFIFVTDAEDSIQDVASCVSAKGQCIQAYGNKLDCECVLTGSGGSCSAELKQIFGNHAFHHCSDANFQNVLTAICGGIQKANSIARDVLPNLEQEVANFANSEEKDQKELGENMQEILNKLETVKTKTAAAKATIDSAKREISNLNARTPGIISRADTASGEGPMTAAEGEIEQTVKQYTAQYTNTNRAGEQLDEASKALEDEARKADKMAENLSKKADEISQKASVIVSNIIRTIQELSNITSGAYQQVKDLKGKFNQQLQDLLAVVSSNEQLMKEFESVKDKVTQSFKDLRSRKTELKDFKNEIATHIQELNAALQRLDDRW